MRRIIREEFWNLPNILTLCRIAAIPFVMLLIWRGAPKDCVLAAWAYSLAAATDYVDGWLARKWNQVTLMGRLLDPLADKLMVMGMLIMLVTLMRVPGWLVVVILAREMTINGLRSVASIEGLEVPSDRLGKKKTALQMIGVMCLLVHYPYPVHFFSFYVEVVDFNRVGLIVLSGSVIMSILSAINYFRNFFIALEKHREDEHEGTTN
ncbi:MAG: CDP-diacylglycerol--glycerol-3-phosphate 3-phosphatidyltransferase [Bradymonadia bacterium]